MRTLEGQKLCSANDWEEVKKKGDDSIKRWIDGQLDGKSCLVALVGAETANRPWVIHEISRAWNLGKGVVGIRINKLLDTSSRPSATGQNPLAKVTFTGTQRTLADVAQLVDPAGADSKAVYASIANSIEAWIEKAIQIRNNQN